LHALSEGVSEGPLTQLGFGILTVSAEVYHDGPSVGPRAA